MFRTFTWLLHWISLNTHVSAHSSSWSTKQQSVCQRVSIGWFCTRHVWSEKHKCVCPQQQLVGQPLTLGCSPELTSSATHMWVLTAAIGLPKLLKVQNLHLTSSLGYSARHMCVFTAAVGRPTLSWTSCETHVCMCSQQQPSRSAKVFSKLPKLQLTCSAPDMCVFRNTHVYSCVCPQQQLVGQPLTLGCNPAAIGRPTLACVYSETHMCMPTAAIGRPFLDPWVQPSIDFFFNTCVCAHSRNWPAKVLNVQNLHLASSLGYSATHMCVFTVHSSTWSTNPQLSSSATHVCMCLQQQSVCQSFLNAQSFK